MMYKYVFLCLCLLIVGVFNQRSEEAEKCTLPDSEEGRCTKIDDCTIARTNSTFRSSTKVCGFYGSKPIVCCPKDDIEKGCKPVTPRRPDMKFGRIAFQKCIEYQEQVVFPCLSYPSLTGAVLGTRRDGCQDEPPPLTAGSDGIDASRGEFPHMALLGYGDSVPSAEWDCGGTIISEKFILTAAHCTVHKILGQVAFARLGLLKRSDPLLKTRVYSIAGVVRHPQYKPPSKYHDIALLETDNTIEFVNKFVSPACLDVEDDPGDGAYASATGWGALGEWKDTANVLQIMELTKFSTEECSRHYEQFRLIRNGIDNETQVCYGHRHRPVDTCKGDSGGPLQVNHSAVYCMHKVVGVTSFGRSCGRTAQPGVYTRVRYYVPWVESVVWQEG